MTPRRPDVFNKFAVGASAGGAIVILNLPLQARQRGGGSKLPEWPAVGPLTTDEALNLAAYLVAVTGERERFAELLAAICAT